jgi:hypothetical protein
VENHTLIEIAFSVYDVPAAEAFKSGASGEHSNIPRARQLAFKLLTEYNKCTAKNIGELFNISSFTVSASITCLNNNINRIYVSQRILPVINKYREAVSIIMNCKEK